ncbi:hypothetical protein AQUCO_01300442v1, partial [Aquilegia coerulea]
KTRNSLSHTNSSSIQSKNPLIHLRKHKRLELPDKMVGPETPEDLERKKKKEEKAKEKEAKRLKALQKKEASKLQEAQKASNTSKKSEKKNAKRVAEEENFEDFVDPATPPGEKKQLSPIMAKQYNPNLVEKSWYAWWEQKGFFVADSKSSKPPFVIVLPPPNVTGALHIGHGLTAAIQDTIIRWRRMSGYNTLWVPGMDHAGIATQVWKWKTEYGSTILNQERRLGVSLDWSRECFTMDDPRSKAVTEAFVRLYKENLIKRDYRLVNWDCVLRTAISDIEVDYKDIKERTLINVPGYKDPVEFGVLTSFAYPLEGGSDEIVVATTRVETMLGDIAIAVHPKDARYTKFHGKFAIHPFNGRKLPIICDDILVKMEFGTGAVKITPAHDPNDFEFGNRYRKRYNLEFINIFTDDGKINSHGGSNFEGMPRFKARVAVIETLKAKGLYRGDASNEMVLGFCSRTQDVIEPMIKPQWFVDCTGMAKDALNAVFDEDNKKIEIIPKQYSAEWKRWLENIRDWCISRQLWWGHQIPAWYVTLEDDESKEFGVYDKNWVVGRNEEEAQVEANDKFAGKTIIQMVQDPDVLDTWFSSGLFPLSVLGWPDNTDDFKAFYPTSVLETGHDILFFWVARMVMLGMKLGGDVPFRKIYLHPMIRDAHGRKMSKSLGNVIDPLEVINGISLEGLHKRLEEGNLDPNELDVAKAGQKKDFPSGIAECGADALRFALVSYTAQSDRINLDIQRVVGYRQWCNKLWNAIRFAMSKLGDNYVPHACPVLSMPFSCRWILSVLNKAIDKTVSSLDSYEFSDAATAVYSWWQFQLCDIFIEVIKPYFNGDDPKFESERSDARDTLWICLDTGLRLLHPFMPFVTEELWQRLPKTSESWSNESIMITKYPSVEEEWTNEEIESEMGLVEAAVKSLRSLRSQLPPSERRPAYALCKSDQIAAIIRGRELEIRTLASVSSLEVLADNDARLAECGVEVVSQHLSVYLQLQGALNAEFELEKLVKKREEKRKQYESLKKKTSASGYKQKVPQNIQDDDVAKLDKLVRELALVEETNRNLESTIAEDR